MVVLPGENIVIMFPISLCEDMLENRSWLMVNIIIRQTDRIPARRFLANNLKLQAV
jgi:hypothetical protein